MSNSEQPRLSTLPLYWVKQPVQMNAALDQGLQILYRVVIFELAVCGNEQDQASRRRRFFPRPASLWWQERPDRDYAKRVGLKRADLPLYALLTPTGYLDREGWAHEIRKACRRHRIPLGLLESAMRHPASAASMAYRMLRLASSRLGTESKEVALALATLGSAAGALLKRQLCEVCFRVAFPGVTRCRFHSRAKVLASPESAQATRAARAVGKELPGARREARTGLKSVDREDIVTGAIFRSPMRDPEGWRRDLLEAISQAPNVRHALHPRHREFSPKELLSELRRSMDPDHWAINDWVDTVDQAEHWLAKTIEVSPGGPPVGPRGDTRLRIEQIEDLLVNGYKVPEIAACLGISLSNIYQLMHRYGVVRGVRGMCR